MRLALICLILLTMAVIDIVTSGDQSVPDGTVYGHVYDAQTKQPVPGAWVYCQETKCPKQLTDSNGYYAIENCFSPSSTYIIECTKTGYPTVKNTAKTDSSGKAKVDFNLNNTPNAVTTIVKSWKKTYGGPEGDSGYSIQQTSDGGYVIVGSTSSFGVGKRNIWLIKTDSDGNKLWDKTFGGYGYDDGKSVQQTKDGGYIIAGETTPTGNAGPNIWLIKTDVGGNRLWDKTFGGSSISFCRSVQQTNDGGYIIAGILAGTNPNFWIIKTDANGNKQFDRTFTGTNGAFANSIQQTSDGGYIALGGVYRSENAEDIDVWLIKTNSQGNKQWDRTFEGTGSNSGISVQQTSDGKYIIDGLSINQKVRTWLIRTDSNGYKLWDKTIGDSGFDQGNSIRQTSDGGYIIAGGTKSIGDGSIDAWLVKTDANGNKIWDRIFGESGLDEVQSAYQTKDGGYIIVGKTDSQGAGKSDVWLIKTDSEGNVEG